MDSLELSLYAHLVFVYIAIRLYESSDCIEFKTMQLIFMIKGMYGACVRCKLMIQRQRLDNHETTI